MKMIYEDKATGETVEINARRITVLADDGRDAFDVNPGKDGRSVEVRGLETFKLDGVHYGSRIQAVPYAGNLLKIEAREFDRD